MMAGAHYAASKAAIISVTKNFAQTLASEGVMKICGCTEKGSRRL